MGLEYDMKLKQTKFSNCSKISIHAEGRQWSMKFGDSKI